MENLMTAIAISLIVSYFIFIVKCYSVFNRYRDMYQERMNPKFPFSRQAILKAQETNLASFLLNVPLSPFLWWKTIFQSIADPELRSLQRKLRKYMLYCLLCIMGAIFFFVFANFNVRGTDEISNVESSVALIKQQNKLY